MRQLLKTKKIKGYKKQDMKLQYAKHLNFKQQLCDQNNVSIDFIQTFDTFCDYSVTGEMGEKMNECVGNGVHKCIKCIY